MSADPAVTPEKIPLDEAEPLLLWRGWLAAIGKDHDALLAWMLASLPWRQHYKTGKGWESPMPRLECWFADRGGVPYDYGGNTYVSSPMHEFGLDRIKARVQDTTGARFDAVFANLYRHGKDSIGFHDDGKEGVFGDADAMVIASLSLGWRRPFVVQSKRTAPKGRKKNAPVEEVSVDLGEGDLLVMGRGVQSKYLHGIPKLDDDSVRERVNLTFRRLRT